MDSITTESASGADYEQICQQLGTNPDQGLSWAEAERRLQFSGYNELTVKPAESLLVKYLEQFKNPLIILLLASAVISLTMQQFDDAFSITFVSALYIMYNCSIVFIFIFNTVFPGNHHRSDGGLRPGVPLGEVARGA